MTDFNDMIAGYQRFFKNEWESHRKRWNELSAGQSPKVLVIACSDSRVDPAIVFDRSPGEIFVVRNVAALVPPFETDHSHHGVSAAVEYAVQFLSVKEIVVMGHGSCGGCEAALTSSVADKPHGEGRHVADWIAMLDEARDQVISEIGMTGDKPLREMEHQAVRVSLRNLMTFPYVKEKVEAGELTLVGTHFGIGNGELLVLRSERDEFEKVS